MPEVQCRDGEPGFDQGQVTIFAIPEILVAPRTSMQIDNQGHRPGGPDRHEQAKPLRAVRVFDIVEVANGVIEYPAAHWIGSLDFQRL